QRLRGRRLRRTNRDDLIADRTAERTRQIVRRHVTVARIRPRGRRLRGHAPSWLRSVRRRTAARSARWIDLPLARERSDRVRKLLRRHAAHFGAGEDIASYGRLLLPRYRRHLIGSRRED